MIPELGHFALMLALPVAFSMACACVMEPSVQGV